MPQLYLKIHRVFSRPNDHELPARNRRVFQRNDVKNQVPEILSGGGKLRIKGDGGGRTQAVQTLEERAGCEGEAQVHRAARRRDQRDNPGL